MLISCGATTSRRLLIACIKSAILNYEIRIIGDACYLSLAFSNLMAIIITKDVRFSKGNGKCWKTSLIQLPRGKFKRLSLIFCCWSTMATLLLRQQLDLWYLDLSLSLLGVTDTHVFGRQGTGKKNKYQLRLRSAEVWMPGIHVWKSFRKSVWRLNVISLQLCLLIASQPWDRNLF